MKLFKPQKMKNTFLYFFLLLMLNFSCKDLDEISFIVLTIEGKNEVTTTSFKVTGEIAGLVEGDILKEYGFVYSCINPIPDFNDEKFLNGSIATNRIFTATITDLVVNATYYVRTFVQKEGETPIFSDHVEIVELNKIAINFSKTVIEKEVGQVTFRNTIEGLEAIDSIDNYGHVWSNELQPTIETGITNLFGKLQANSVDIESIVFVNQLEPLVTYYVRSFIVTGKTVIYSDNIAAFEKGDIWQLYSDDFGGIFSPFSEFTFEIGNELYVYKGKGRFGKYNFIDQVWTDLAPFWDIDIFNPITFTIDGKGYVGTGKIKDENGIDVPIKDFWEFNPNEGINGKWTPLGAYSGEIRKDIFSFSIGGSGYVGFGKEEDINEKKDTIVLLKYDPLNGWKKAPNSEGFTVERSEGMTYFSFKDKGCIKIEFPLLSCYCYEPEKGWQKAPDFPIDFSGSSDHRFFTVDNSGFIILADEDNNFWEFDSEADNGTGEWIPRIDFQGGLFRRGNPFSVNGKGYISTAINTPVGTIKEQLWEYNPPVD